MAETRDKYEEAIDYLREHPDEIEDAWYDGFKSELTKSHPAACLFAGATPSGSYASLGHGRQCGCLTSIKGGNDVAWTQRLTDEIRADDRLPDDPHFIRIDHLPVFAEWQRRIDHDLRRPCPVTSQN